MQGRPSLEKGAGRLCIIYIKGGADFLDAIIVSLIGLAGSAIGSILGVLASARLTSYRLDQLEKRVQAHNNLIERMYQVEERTELQEEKIRAAVRRIENLERRAEAS